MKAALFLALVMPLAAADEIEGTVWYDADGEVVLVEGPAAEAADEPFVPEWKKREIERRERASNPRRRSSWSRSRWNRGWYGYPGTGYYYTPGWSVCRPSVSAPSGGFGSYFGSVRGSRVSIIIRR
ncbi:hypothetical protein HAHE_24020 [Haloferula helveola]|uniref:Uncharacterized protein n=1 Tax=Haloferula helveola TaxID=490095 RepID=A0ABM7RAP4_9BACT|nr:hypothetical protein HAHE_24020 [Haloferula helveola]